MPQWFCCRADRDCRWRGARSADRGRTRDRASAGNRRARPGSADASRRRASVRLEHAAARHRDVHVRGIARIDRGSSASSARRACRPGRRRTRPCACGCALKPATPSHVAPPSAERNSPCGDVPAYHTPGCDACPGVSQNVWSTTRPLSGANAGGLAASFHVRPPSCERNTVGPRWPVRAAASSVLPSRGSAQRVVDDVAEERGRRQLPRAARGVAGQRPQALAGRDQQAHATGRRGGGARRHRRSLLRSDCLKPAKAHVTPAASA